MRQIYVTVGIVGVDFLSVRADEKRLTGQWLTVWYRLGNGSLLFSTISSEPIERFSMKTKYYR